MNKIKNLYVLLMGLCLLPLASMAQIHSLSGTVCDENGTLPYATVMVWQGNDTVKAAYGITDKKGDFALHGLKEGPYKGMVKFTGFEHLPFSVNLDKDVHLDTLRLQPNVKQLNEVQVTASKVFEDKFDKLRMNVSELKLPPTATYVDVLKEIPGSFYSPSQNTLTVLNKAVLVLLNGRPVRLNFEQLSNMLQGGLANDIGELEIMYETPPRLKGEWDGPVVNIITKKKLATGFYGSVSGDLQMRKRLGPWSSFHLNYRTLKTNTYLSFSQDCNPRVYSYRYWQYREGDDTLMRRESNHVNCINRYSLNGGTGIQMNDNNSLDFNFSGSLKYDHDNIDEYILDRETNILSYDTARNDSRSLGGDIYYKHNFNSPKHYFTVDANMSRNLNESGSNRRYTYLLDSVVYNRDASPYLAWLFSTRADYYREWDKCQLEAGLSFNRSELQNDFSFENLIDDVWHPDTLVTNDFTYKENNYGAYAVFTHQMNEMFSYTVSIYDNYVQTLGISETTNSVTPKNYNEFTPDFTLRYKPNDNHFFTFVYLRGYSEPNFRYLNPFRRYESPVYYEEGNPYLSHSIINTIRLRYRYRYWLNFGVTYTNTRDGILLVPQFDADNAIIGYTYGNFGKNDDLKFTLNLSTRLFDKRLSLSFNGLVEYMYYNSGDNLNYKNSLWHHLEDLHFSYLLVQKYDLTIDGYALYSSQKLREYAVTRGIPEMGIGLSAKFLDGNLTTSLFCKDLFNWDQGYRTTFLNGVVTKSDNIIDSRYIRFSVRYSFNRKNLKRFQNHKGGNVNTGRL